MAETPHPLIWNHSREVENATGLGGVIHYYEESAQSLYLNSGLDTVITKVTEGHWKEAEYSDVIEITEDNWDLLRFDHPANGTLYGVASGPNGMEFLRYSYSMDISALTDSWGWMSQIDNAVSQFDCEVYNIGADLFSSDTSLFQPGARITLAIRMGDSKPCPLGVAWLDETQYDATAETVSMSGRNSIGYFLKDQTFDETCEWSGVASNTVQKIFDYASVPKCNIQPMDKSKTFKFEPGRTLLDGVQEVINYYATMSTGLEIAELPDGTVCLGYYDWIAKLLPKGYYLFHEGSEVFTRETTKNIDGSYTALRVTGRDAYGDDLTPVIVPITNFPFWALAGHRTNHISAPDGLTQAQLQEWAETQAKAYQYVGIGETFTSPFRPQLLVGDVASVIRGNQGINLGIITEVKHSFSRKNGFTTDFSVDSGGVVTDGENYTLYSRAAELHGFNRKQRIMDLVRYVSGK